MRIWDLPVRVLCRQHLLGEHRELHGAWATLVHRKKGYSRHPEALRWAGRLCALEDRHAAQVAEMERRGWTGHKTPLTATMWARENLRWGVGLPARRYAVDSLASQVRNLRGKRCACDLRRYGKIP